MLGIDTILTQTRVASHGPGHGADLARIFRPPQVLKLCKFTGRADEGAQALWVGRGGRESTDQTGAERLRRIFRLA